MGMVCADGRLAFKQGSGRAPEAVRLDDEAAAGVRRFLGAGSAVVQGVLRIVGEDVTGGKTCL